MFNGMLIMLMGAASMVILAVGAGAADGVEPDSFDRSWPIVVGHYPHYAVNSLPIASIPYDKLSHIGYFSLSPMANGDLDEINVDVADLQELVARADAHGVKTFITVGGWGASEHFSAMAANLYARINFAARLAQYCLDYNLDGADLDWEPVSTETDKTNYSLLVGQVHDEFESLGLGLTVSVCAYGDEITPETIALVDWLNIMAYDNTPPHHSTFDSAVSALDHWENYGAPREKAVLGVPFYGKTAAGASCTYKLIVELYHPGPEADYVAGIGFNGINTIKRKTQYVLDNGYRGVMTWELSQDAAGGSSLLTAIRDTIVATSPANFNGDYRVDLSDFSILGFAWQSHPDDDNWNQVCDISTPRDNVINQHDLAVFCGSWLAGL
jgi:opacity protein-like surface antigen